MTDPLSSPQTPAAASPPWQKRVVAVGGAPLMNMALCALAICAAWHLLRVTEPKRADA